MPPTPLRPLLSPTYTHIYTPHRHASLLRRPHRPYTFTQLMTLSDGSTFTHRTSSPIPVYKSTRDTRNTPLWNPSNAKLANVEEDEAGRLKAFRRRFGRGWDAEEEVEGEGGKKGQEEEEEAEVLQVGAGEKGARKAAATTTSTNEITTPSPAADAENSSSSSSTGDNLMDLISSYGQQEAAKDKSGKAMKGNVRASGKGGR